MASESRQWECIAGKQRRRAGFGSFFAA